MATNLNDIVSRLKNAPLWSFACKIDPVFKQVHECRLAGVVYSRQRAKQCLVMAHLRIVRAIAEKTPGTEQYQELSKEVVSSPRALSLLISNPEFIEPAKTGSMSLNDLISVSRMEI